MYHSFLFALAISLFVSCAPQPSLAQKTTPTQFALTATQKQKIAQKIWNNECGGTVNGLTTWNEGENFPSLGIGHFIWYPKGVNGPFTESFPQFIQYARRAGLNPPAVAMNADCPWRSKREFTARFQSKEFVDLRSWLASNLGVQADFIIAKSRASLPKVLQSASAGERDRVLRNYQSVATTSNGMYALIDYVNFKGEGTNLKERYNGKGWGLLQALSSMRTSSPGQDAAQAFSQATKYVLGRRIANAPPSRGEERWRAGWFKRCETYTKPL